MNIVQDEIESLAPTERKRFFDMVVEAGLNVDDWGNYSKGLSAAAANPRYCYEWALRDQNRLVFNIWHHELQRDATGIYYVFNIKERLSTDRGVRRGRTNRFSTLAGAAFCEEFNVRVALMKRGAHSSKAMLRRLDDQSWYVEVFEASDRIVFRRGERPADQHVDVEADCLGFSEGQKQMAFRNHRVRERAARDAKIADFLDKYGRLFCEVDGCGFDFESVYGEIGRGFAHVHHLLPLSTAPESGTITNISDLAVVCANCHAMVHIRGECRPLKDLIHG